MNRRDLGGLLCLLGAVVMLIGAVLPWYEAKLAKLNDPAWSRVILRTLFGDRDGIGLVASVVIPGIWKSPLEDRAQVQHPPRPPPCVPSRSGPTA